VALWRLSADHLRDCSLGHPKSSGDVGLGHAVGEESFDAGTSLGGSRGDTGAEAIHLLGDVGHVRERIFPVHACALIGWSTDGKTRPRPDKLPASATLTSAASASSLSVRTMATEVRYRRDGGELSHG
jgi:hypothetical protein